MKHRNDGRRRSASDARRQPSSAAARRDPLDAVALIMGLTTAAVLLAVDPFAAASFDAPKRFLAMLGIALALPFAAGVRAHSFSSWSRSQRLAVAAYGVAAALIIASAIVSPHRGQSLDTLRILAAFAFVPLLAARNERVWPAVARAYVIAAAINAVLSLLQFAGSVTLFRYASVGGRANTSALVGNDGVLSLLTALAAILVLERALVPAKGVSPTGPRVLLALFVATILANRSITALAVLLVATGTFFLLRRIRRPPVAALLLAAIALVGALSAAAVHRPSWNAALTYRIGPWAAAAEMVRERPSLGFGPGTFATELVAHRIRADLRAGTSLANPALVGSYAQAHSDYLQGAAEFGLPALLLLCASLMLAVSGHGDDPPADGKLTPVVVLVAGAIMALTWFPLQVPGSAFLLLTAAGTMWRTA